MGYIFDDWKKILENLQSCVEKDIEEIHQQKAEVQQIRSDIFNRLDSGRYYYDDSRIVISAPEIVIGNVDKSGSLKDGGVGRVIIKGSDVSLEGVGELGKISSRAPIIHQLAVDPGVDGLENVVCDNSEIVSQACGIVLHSSDAKGAFSQNAAPEGRGGVFIHADKKLRMEAVVSAEKRKRIIQNEVNELSKTSSELKQKVEAQKKIVYDGFARMAKLLDDEGKINQAENYLTRVNVYDIEELHEKMTSLMPTVYRATQSFIESLSQLAEVNRRKRALEKEKTEIKTGDEFKNNTTGASMSIAAETINVVTADGDDNTHINAEAGINVKTPRMNILMQDDKGALVKDGGLAVNAQNVSFTSIDPKDNGKQLPVVGEFKVQAKNVNFESIDYQSDDKGPKEKELTADSKVSITAKTIEVATTSPKGIERDGNGKLTKGEYTAEGDVIIKSKTINMESLDYQLADGKLKTKALTKDGKLSVRAEKMNFLSADAEGKATGSISMNAKAVSVKSMDVDKEKLTDSALATGSTMLLVSEKMYVGAKDKSVKSKKVQAMSEEIGAFADKTLEIQQGDGKALVQLADGNAAMGSSKNQICGDTEVKGEIKAPKATIDSLEAKSAFKSPNITDGMGGGGGAGKLSAKLKAEDAPKE